VDRGEPLSRPRDDRRRSAPRGQRRQRPRRGTRPDERLKTLPPGERTVVEIGLRKYPHHDFFYSFFFSKKLDLVDDPREVFRAGMFPETLARPVERNAAVVLVDSITNSRASCRRDSWIHVAEIWRRDSPPTEHTRVDETRLKIKNPAQCQRGSSSSLPVRTRTHDKPNRFSRAAHRTESARESPPAGEPEYRSFEFTGTSSSSG